MAVGRRAIQHVHPGIIGQGRVPLQVPGISLQVLIGAELRGVDEEAHHQAVAGGLAVPHEAQVPPVEVAHGGHQGNLPPQARATRPPGPESPWDRALSP